MKEKKVTEAISTPVVEETSKRFKLPTKFSLKKGTLIKVAVGIVVALILIPAVDWLIQTSITSQYVAFYKNADVPRAAYIKELERQYGEQVVNEMLAKAAIAQAAKDKGITVSDDEVNTAINADKTRAGISTDADFEAALAQNGITANDYRAYVRVTVTLDKLLEGTLTEPTEKEINDYFTENKELFKGKKLADVKEQIVSEIKASMLNTKRQEWISTALTGYNDKNTLVSASSRQYGFMKSISLIQRLFSKDPTK
ncbi:SurA N-terminal domain-containing protein [bacterium]|nr:SurA N-terminal domain-containing protein [bacterium]